MRTVADYRQLNDALFHAGTNSGSSAEYVDGAERPALLRRRQVHGLARDPALHPGHPEPGRRGPADARRGRRRLDRRRRRTCTFTVKNTGVNAPTDPALHPQDETASLHNDIYRLSASASGSGWKATCATRSARRSSARASRCRCISRRRGAAREHGDADRDVGERPVQDGHGDLRAAQRHRRRHGAGDAVADARRAGLVRRVPAGRGAGLLRLHAGHGHLDRG